MASSHQPVRHLDNDSVTDLIPIHVSICMLFHIYQMDVVILPVRLLAHDSRFSLSYCMDMSPVTLNPFIKNVTGQCGKQRCRH